MLQFITSSFIFRHPIYSRTTGSSPVNIAQRRIHLSYSARMKIHADKIEGGPPHALTVRDVRLIFSTVPQDWIEEIKEVRIANSLDRYSHTYFSRYHKCLNIYSRDRTKKYVLTAVLSELAAVSLHKDRGLRYRSKALRDQLKKMTAPFLQQLLPLIDIQQQVKAHVSMEGFKEIRFPLVPNDVE